MKVFTWFMRANVPLWNINWACDVQALVEGVARNLQERGPCALTALDWH